MNDSFEINEPPLLLNALVCNVMALPRRKMERRTNVDAAREVTVPQSEAPRAQVDAEDRMAVTEHYAHSGSADQEISRRRPLLSFPFPARDQRG